MLIQLSHATLTAKLTEELDMTLQTVQSKWGETSLITSQIKPQGEMQRNIIHSPPGWKKIAKCVPVWQI